MATDTTTTTTDESSLDELKKKLKYKSAIPFAMFICAFAAIFLVILLFYTIRYKQRIEEISRKILSGNQSNAAGYDHKLLLKQLSIIAAYTTIIYYAIKELKFIEIMVLLPCILFITLPFILQYVFDIYYIPTENPLVTFIFLIVTFNLWYAFSANVDEETFSEDSKALSVSVNMSVAFILLYILFKHHYKFSTRDSLFRAFGLTGASGVFMMSAPMYVYMPIEAI